MVVGLGLVKDPFHQVTGTHYPRTGVEHTRLWFIEGYSAGMTVGLEHYYNDVRVPGPTLLHPGQTFRSDLYGDIAYYRVLFREQGGLHCSYLIALKDYGGKADSVEDALMDISGRKWAASWHQVEADIHEITVSGKDRCSHASSYKQSGLVVRKP